MFSQLQVGIFSLGVKVFYFFPLRQALELAPGDLLLAQDISGRVGLLFDVVDPSAYFGRQ